MAAPSQQKICHLSSIYRFTLIGLSEAHRMGLAEKVQMGSRLSAHRPDMNFEEYILDSSLRRRRS